MKRIHAVFLAFTFGLLLSCSEKVNNTPAVKVESFGTPILITNVAIFTGKDDQLRKGMDVRIENGTIRSITPHKETNPKPEVKVIAGTGKVLMPGLIDAHVHISGSGSPPWRMVKANVPYNLSAYLYAGITTVYDLGGLAGDLEKIEKKVEKGKLTGPDIYHTHIPITVKNSHPVPLTKMMTPWPLKKMVDKIAPLIEKEEDAVKIIASYQKKGVDFIKITCDKLPSTTDEMPFHLLKALVDEAHRKGFKAIVHIGSPQNAVNAAKAGADALAHGIYRGKLTPEQADTLAAANIPIIYTLAGFENVHQVHQQAYVPDEWTQKLVSSKVLKPVTEEHSTHAEAYPLMARFYDDVSENRPYWKNNFKLLTDRGVQILVGTDSNLPGTYAGATYFQEMDMLKEYGLTNFQILHGATAAGAGLFLEEPDFGTVEKGKKANLLLLNNNPLEDIDAIKTPELIIKNGKFIERTI